MESAFLDLCHADHFHELDGGPSANKTAAALAAWINQIKPIQILRLIDDVTAAEINARFALNIGIATKIVNENPAYDDEQSIAVAREIIEERERKARLILYTLVWRNPTFRTLSSMFELF